MKVPYSEDLASHTGPESCGYGGDPVAEALTGEGIGRVLSLENAYFGSADGVDALEGNTVTCAKASTSGLPVVADLEHVPNLSAREPGGPTACLQQDGAADRRGNSKEAIRG